VVLESWITKPVITINNTISLTTPERMREREGIEMNNCVCARVCFILEVDFGFIPEFIKLNK